MHEVGIMGRFKNQSGVRDSVFSIYTKSDAKIDAQLVTRSTVA
jgi:hypothetical protein